jgi:hypothetical protein
MKATLLVTAVAALALGVPAWGAPAGAHDALLVRIGTTRALTKHELRPGAIVVCTSRGRTLTVAAPTGRQAGSGAVWPGDGHLNFHLTVDTAPGGYVVTCGLGGIHW